MPFVPARQRPVRTHRSSRLFGLAGLGLFVAVNACGNTTTDFGAAGGAGGHAAGRVGASEGGAKSEGGAAGTGKAGASAGTSAAGEAGLGAAGAPDDSAGAGGEAGASSTAITCTAGGPLFVAGNYLDLAGNDFLLRTTATAATLARVPKGAADPGKLPQLFLVERSCAPGGAVIVQGETEHYRLDFVQNGAELAVCFSAAPTLQAALELAPAAVSRSADTGCLGKPFETFSQGAL